MLPNQTQTDVVNDDGSVTRTITTVLTLTADQYQAEQTQLQTQIDTLTAQLPAIQANTEKIQTTLSKKVTPLNKI